MTPELIAILAVGVTLAGLMVAIWRDARAHTNQGLAELRTEIRDLRTEVRAGFAQIRADFLSHREEVRADNQSLREELHADMQIFRQEVRADLTEVKSDVAHLRTDVQSLTERTSRVEGVIEGLFTTRGAPDRREDAA